jgi:spore coat polysaccharide biosynthesis protein SpsF
MKVGFLITARLKSTRLPEKIMREVCGRAVITHMLDRVKLAKRVNQIIVCTSANPQDDRLVDLAIAEGVSYFRGDEDDVLKRLSDAAVAFDVDYILSATADCPFVDPVYADRIVTAFEDTNADLIRAEDLPHGAYCYGIKPSALRKVLEIKDSRDTEVWGRYFTDTDLFEIYDLPIRNPLHRQPALRMTLDYLEDLEFFNKVFAHLYRPGEVFSLDEILRFLKEHPEVVDINRDCEAKYQKRVAKQSGIKLKARYNVRRVAVFGAGSIGQRHIGNLHRLGITDIIALRSRKGHFKELDPSLGIRQVEDWQQIVASRPDVAIVTNPTSLHLETASRLIPHVRGLFVEKPLASTLDGVESFLGRVEAHRVTSFVGYDLQFHPVAQKIRELLESDKLGKPLLFQCQVGHWLPDWHPYEDYRKAYYSRKELGGGVALTLIHEVDLALKLLGPARVVSCLLPEYDGLQLDVDVIADMMVQHISGGVTQIHLDYVQRPLHRCGVVSCERGSVSYDLVYPRVAVSSQDEPSPQVVFEDPRYDANQPYVSEMSTFLRYVSEGRVRHDFDVWRATQSLAVIDAALKSAKSGRLTNMPTWVSKLG